jgi:LmbE family N-acetylglucosaminyl deacetylase
MRALFIHAHFDDYEFTAAGLFARWKAQLGNDFHGQVIICTDGRAGHHARTRAETGALRLSEQEASAAIGGYDFKPLRLRDGNMPREACLTINTEILAAVWKAIRDFRPDYLICPPVPSDPLVGIHIDHAAVGEIVRKVAYMINVPHAFTPEYPAVDETRSELCPVPVILNCHDAYMAAGNTVDLAIDVDAVFSDVCRMSYCHQSQIAEWLPWVSAPLPMTPPKDAADWEVQQRQRLARRNRRYGIPDDRPRERFSVTSWGRVPSVAELQRDIPGIDPAASNLKALGERIAGWGG